MKNNKKTSKYGSYQKTKGGYIYRSEYLPCIHGCLELFVTEKPKDAKIYRTKSELNEIEKLKRKIRKLTDKLATAQMKCDKAVAYEEKCFKSLCDYDIKIRNVIKYIDKVLKKNCGSVLSEKTLNGLIDILRGEYK